MSINKLPDISTEMVQDGAIVCRFTEESTGCDFNFTYKYQHHQESYDIHVRKETTCPPKANTLGKDSIIICNIYFHCI